MVVKGCTLHLLKAADNLGLTIWQAPLVSPAEVWPVLTLPSCALSFASRLPCSVLLHRTSALFVTLDWWLFVLQHVPHPGRL